MQIVADHKLGDALGSQPTLSRWENAPSARDLAHNNDLLCQQFIRICGDQVRPRGEILLDIDSTDDPTHGQQQLSFFNGAYGQHMYHPMLIFERHTGCLLAARLRPGTASSHARIVPMLLRLVPRLQSAFPGIKIKLRGDAGFALPLLYQFCEFFAITYALEAVAILVAVMGVAGALLALVIDRRRELGLLRFLGCSAQQIRKLILVEAGLLGLLANVAGVILGFVMSLILIFVINKQSFGWTIRFHWSVAVLLGALTSVYIATVLAGLYPAQIAVRLNPLEVVHDE